MMKNSQSLLDLLSSVTIYHVQRKRNVINL